MSELSAVILAGGGGRRLGGVEKALLRLDGRTLLERVVAAVLTACSDLVVVTSRPEPLRSALERAGWSADPERAGVLRRPGEAGGEVARMRLVSERERGAGPVAALAAGLGTARASLAWALACDLAFPHPEVGRMLAAALRETVASASHGARAAIPRIGGRLQPLCAVYERPAAETAAACLREGLRRASDFLDRLAIHEVPEERFRSVGDPATLFLDVDTPEDLERARRIARGRART